MKIDLNQIGYYKYTTKNNFSDEFISEYPIHEGMMEYIKNNIDSVEIEYQNLKPKKINNKYIVLI